MSTAGARKALRTWRRVPEAKGGEALEGTLAHSMQSCWMSRRRTWRRTQDLLVALAGWVWEAGEDVPLELQG